MTATDPRRTIRIVLIAAAAWAATAGCRREQFAPSAKFVNLYVELKLATAAAGDPIRANEVRRAILARYKMTPEDFHRQYRRLAAEPDAWKDFQNRVLVGIEEFQREKTKEEGDGS